MCQKEAALPETSIRGGKIQTWAYFSTSLVNNQMSKEKHGMTLKGAQNPAAVAITFWDNPPEKADQECS